MLYTAKSYDNLIGLSGFSDTLLKNHFTLYQGYVSNVNRLIDEMALATREGKAVSPNFAELKRRFGWEWNGMRLHEYYFENLWKETPVLNQKSALYQKIAADFGSYENWEKEFKAVAVMRGIGWVILYYDAASDCLFNMWVTEHDAGHAAGAKPLLVLDVFEHAYVTDYGIKRPDYIEAFFKAINWPEVEKRFGV